MCPPSFTFYDNVRLLHLGFTFLLQLFYKASVYVTFFLVCHRNVGEARSFKTGFPVHVANNVVQTRRFCMIYVAGVNRLDERSISVDKLCIRIQQVDIP